MSESRHDPETDKILSILREHSCTSYCEPSDALYEMHIAALDVSYRGMREDGHFLRCFIGRLCDPQQYRGCRRLLESHFSSAGRDPRRGWDCEFEGSCQFLLRLKLHRFVPDLHELAHHPLLLQFQELRDLLEVQHRKR